ncbi:SUKH-4 family immunity protein [Streptomyces sp. NPDC088726]|uniref:SUKH-4 family immunity protein n=1 Tax=Streptomyces sp. NPDC088726 TaxID=3365874 RepID=UPI0037F4D682
MIFELSRDELIHTFGEERVHQAPSDTARAAGFSGDALTFLTTIGLPDSEFISVPRLNAEGFGFRAVPVGELSSTWNLPAAAANWVFLGNFEVSAVLQRLRGRRRAHRSPDRVPGHLQKRDQEQGPPPLRR